MAIFYFLYSILSSTSTRRILWDTAVIATPNKKKKEIYIPAASKGG
jgi:hypothetical protein